MLAVGAPGPLRPARWTALPHGSNAGGQSECYAPQQRLVSMVTSCTLIPSMLLHTSWGRQAFTCKLPPPSPPPRGLIHRDTNVPSCERAARTALSFCSVLYTATMWRPSDAVYLLVINGTWLEASACNQKIIQPRDGREWVTPGLLQAGACRCCPYVPRRPSPRAAGSRAWKAPV